MLQNSPFPYNYYQQQLPSGQGYNNGFHSPQIQTPVSTSTPSNNQKQVVISTSQQLNYIQHLQPQQQEQQQMYNPIYIEPPRTQQQSQQPNIYQPTAQQRTSSSNNIPNPNPNLIYNQQKQIVLSTSEQLNYIHHLQPQQQQQQQQIYSPIYNQPPRTQQTQQPRINQPAPQKTPSSNNIPKYSPDTQCIPRNTVPVATCSSFSHSNQQIDDITLCEIPDCRCKQNQPITPKFQLMYSGSNSGLQTPTYNQSSLSPLSQPSLETPSTLTLSTSSKSLSSSYQPSSYHQSNSTNTELEKYCKENELSAYSTNMAKKYLNTYVSVFCEGMLDASYVPKEETYVSEKTLTPTKFEKTNFRKFEESSVYLDSSLYESDRNLKVLQSLDKRKPYNHYVYTKQNHSDSIERMRSNDNSTQFEFFKGGGMDSFNISTSTSNTTTVWSDSTISQLTLPNCLGREQSLQRQDIVPSVDLLRVPSRVIDMDAFMKLKKFED